MIRAALALLVAGGVARAQAVPQASCDSLIAVAAIEHVPSGLFLSVQRIDGAPLADSRANRMILNIGSAFAAPKPFRLNVFSGPSLMRGLRSLNAAVSATPRVPTLTGTYRLRLGHTPDSVRVQVVRQAMMQGFDSAAVEAIVAATNVRELFSPAESEDSLHLDVTFSTDSLPGARRLASASFPRMPVVDASPMLNNPPPTIPPGLEADSAVALPPVILRFVVTREGAPAAGTVEVLRASSVELLRAAVEALVQQRFSPASIKGCPVAQQVDYPFVFVRP